jgi:hypothetical protein
MCVSGRQSWHLILQVRRHFITVDLSSNDIKKLESASQNSSAV